jgi:hypothetical protein
VKPRRILLPAAFELGWILPWLVQLGGGPAWWVVAVALGAGLLVPPRLNRWPVWTVALVIGAGVGAWTSGVAASLAAVVALWRGHASRDDGTPWIGRLVWAAVALAALVVWAPRWEWALALTLLVGVVGMSEAVRPDGVAPVQWWRLGGALALVGLAAAVIAYGLAWWAPWARVTPYLLVAFTTVVGLLVRALVALLPHGLKGRTHPVESPMAPFLHEAARLHGAQPTATHTVVWVLLVLGALLLLGAAVMLGRVWAGWTPAEVFGDDRLEREPSTVQAGRERLRYTRRVVARRMGQARRRGRGPYSWETLSEWLGRTHVEVPAEVVNRYDRIRYGAEPDSAAEADAVRRAWPRIRERVVGPRLPR